jgi:hypothetical protein
MRGLVERDSALKTRHWSSAMPQSARRRVGYHDARIDALLANGHAMQGSSRHLAAGDG